MQEFKTIQSHIDYIRQFIKQTSDDSDYSDQFLYKCLVDKRATVIQQQYSKKKRLSDWNKQTFCVPLEIDGYADCQCLPNIGCKVLRSTTDIPNPISTKYTDIFEVMDISGNVKYYPSNKQKERAYKHSKTRFNKLGYEIYNSKLVIFIKDKQLANPSKTVLVRGIFEDPSELSEINICDQFSGTPTTGVCFDPKTDKFPLDASFNDQLYTLVLQKLGISMQFIEDRTNNAESITKPPTV